MHFLSTTAMAGNNNVSHIINTPVGRFSLIIYFIKKMHGALGNKKESVCVKGADYFNRILKLLGVNLL